MKNLAKITFTIMLVLLGLGFSFCLPQKSDSKEAEKTLLTSLLQDSLPTHNKASLSQPKSSEKLYFLSESLLQNEKKRMKNSKSFTNSETILLDFLETN
ncbi:MAG: hypothetical protein N3A69_16345, partial [Leptospiraceae bacterium]|nr:hypothetical protein [Leptospiraceae bacterium]